MHHITVPDWLAQRVLVMAEMQHVEAHALFTRILMDATVAFEGALEPEDFTHYVRATTKAAVVS